MGGPQLTGASAPTSPLATLAGEELRQRLLGPVRRAEELGIDYVLVAQRWWGTGEEIEASTYDCLAMTAFYAAATSRIRLITAIHPGFFLPAAIAKWGASVDRLTGGRWAVNITSGWHEQEFGMYGAPLLPHDERYERSSEFIQALRAAWGTSPASFHGKHYGFEGLRLEPRPCGPLEVFQGGQSPAAMEMAARHSDWMFFNGGPSEKIRGLIATARAAAAREGRNLRFGLYAIPLCRESDEEAESEVGAMAAARDPQRLAARRERTGGAQGMWQPSNDPLATLDSNEGFASRLIGSPSTILARIREFHEMGVDLLHVALNDQRFNERVLPELARLEHHHR